MMQPMPQLRVSQCSVCGKQSVVQGESEGCLYCLLQLGLGSAELGSIAYVTSVSGNGTRVSGSSASGPRALGASHSGSARDFEREGILPRFGDYELLSEIARGGMGIVYRARQLSLGRLVAVKMILAGQLATLESLQRFRLEAQAAAGLHHPGIVPIYEIGEVETQHFFSMELIDGPSLAECSSEFRVDPLASPSERRAQQRCLAELLARVTRAVEFAHQHGVLHRDLKPSNILIDQQGLPHLTDFGLAKLTGREQSGLTLSHAVLGTPGYLAPEQAAGTDDATTASDIYGLGATLYELLTGRPPFAGANALETMWMAIDQSPVPPRQINPALSPDLETIALCCLEKRPEQRYSSAAALAEDLERFVCGQPILARPVSTWEHTLRWCRRNPWLATLACALMLTFLIGGGTALWQWARAEQANISLQANVAHLEWAAIDDMLQAGQTSSALARAASLLRSDPTDWKAAMFAVSVLEHHSFPVPVSPPIRHPDGTDLTVSRLSPDGQRIATASLDGTARIWDAKTSEQIVPALRHEAGVNWLEFSPNGQLLATCSDEGIACLWDVSTGDRIGKPLQHEEAVLRVHVSPDGRFLLARTNRTVSIWDIDSGELHLGPLRHAGSVSDAKFVANGTCLFTAQRAGQNSMVQAWDLQTGEQTVRLKPDPFIAADMSQDMKRVVTVGETEAQVWDVANAKKLHAIVGETRWMANVLFSPTSEYFATASHSDVAQVWDTETGLAVSGELPHYYTVNGFAFLGSGQQLLTWSDDSTAQVWDIKTSKPFFETMRHANRVQYVDVGVRDGREIFLATVSHRHTLSSNADRAKLLKRSEFIKSGVAQLWQVRDRSQTARRVLELDPNGFDSSEISPDGKLIALGKTAYGVIVMKTDTGERVCDTLPVKGGAWALMFTRDGRRLITTTSRGQVAMWSLPDGKLVFEPVELGTTIQPAEISQDGNFFMTGSTDGIVRLWETATMRLVLELKHGSEINSVDFSPDGRWLASAGEDRAVRIWDAQTGQMVQVLKGHQNEVLRAVFGPDGRHIVSASPDFTARIWDAATGEMLHVLHHQGEVVDAVFSPDGRLVASGSRDQTAKIWDASTGLPLARDLRHERGVRNVRFSPDGNRLMTLDFHGPHQWDVASGHPLTVHLRQPLNSGIGFQNKSGGPRFSPDGNQLVVACGSLEAVVWNVPVMSRDVPEWFPSFLEAVVGQRLVSGTDTPEIVPPTSFLKIRNRLLDATDTDEYTRWAQEWLKSL